MIIFTVIIQLCVRNGKLAKRKNPHIVLTKYAEEENDVQKCKRYSIRASTFTPSITVSRERSVGHVIFPGVSLVVSPSASRGVNQPGAVVGAST